MYHYVERFFLVFSECEYYCSQLQWDNKVELVPLSSYYWLAFQIRIKLLLASTATWLIDLYRQISIRAEMMSSTALYIFDLRRDEWGICRNDVNNSDETMCCW